MENTKLLSIIFLGTTLVLVSNCNNDNRKARTESTTTDKNVMIEASLSKGFQLLESNCFSCHSPNASVENKIAPPVVDIKKYYLSQGVTELEFTQSIIDFMKTPSIEKSKIPGAIERFGLMPEMNFPEEDLKSIATYIYNTDIESPDWFNKHYQNEKKKYAQTNIGLPYEGLGLKVAMTTKGILGKNLVKAINTKGTENALEFCNEKAYPLTDSMAILLNTNIKRVSDKPRNPKNAANKPELEYISKTREKIENNETVKPQIQEIGNKMVGYYPIITDKMCLQCHGKPNIDIKSAVLNKISQLYQLDKATGYDTSQLRGIWVIEMDKNLSTENEN